METILFELVTPDGIKFEGSIYEAVLPTVSGQIAVLPNHAPLTTLASPGVITIRKHKTDSDTQLEHFASGGGLLQITQQSIRFLADTAEHADSIDELKAQRALAQAKEVQRSAKDHVSITDAYALIERNTVRIKVADIRRRHKSKSS